MSTSLFDSSLTPPAGDPTAPAQPLCPGDLPLVLLPVRLETRFFPLPGGGTELRVRIYPDKVHLDTHEPDLSPDERDWGMRYWQDDWAAGADTGARADAWRALADRFGAPAPRGSRASCARPTRRTVRPVRTAPAPRPARVSRRCPWRPPTGRGGVLRRRGCCPTGGWRCCIRPAGRR